MIKVCPVCREKFIAKTAKKFCSIICYVKAHPKKNIGRRKETLCWDCQNACKNCSWSKSFTPVEGWEAIPTKIKGNFEFDEIIDSYMVISCPEFKEDKR